MPDASVSREVSTLLDHIAALVDRCVGAPSSDEAARHANQLEHALRRMDQLLAPAGLTGPAGPSSGVGATPAVAPPPGVVRPPVVPPPPAGAAKDPPSRAAFLVLAGHTFGPRTVVRLIALSAIAVIVVLAVHNWLG